MPTPQDREAARHARRQVRAALALLIAVVMVLVAVGAAAAWRIYAEGNHRFVDRAGPFFAVTEDLSVEMLNEETGVRGYVITANPKLLAPYRQAKKYVRLELALIAKDQSFAPAIPAHLRAMRREVASLDAYFAREIALVKSGPAGQRRAMADILPGKGHFDHLRTAAGALIGDAGEVVKRSHENQRSTLITWLVFLGIAGAAALAVAVALLLRVPGRLYQLFREERFARRAAEQAGEAARALAHVRESVVLLDDEGIVRYWNPNAAALFGLEPGDRGSELLSAITADFQRGGGAGARPVMVGDEERWLTCAESAFEGGRVLVFRDVTDDHRLEQLRSDFVATAAHELRTPLAAVYGAVRTLRHQEHLPAPTVASFLEMIEREAERLKLVMDQLLVSAQLDSADLHLQRQAVDAGALCESLIGSTEVRKPPGIELTLSRPDAGVALQADPDRLRQVVANLIDNAIKYSPGGGRVSVRVSTNGDSGTIQVADDGLGIPAHEQQRIFEKFYRLDPSMTRGIGGSGLGLYISRQLVEQMGGRLSVESRHGVGSTFTISLPLVPAAEPALVSYGDGA